MPIILNDMAATLKNIKMDAMPSYFSKSLTGNGKTTGLLNKNLLPKRQADPDNKPAYNCRDVHTTIPTGSMEWEFIPMDFTKLPSTIYGITKLPEAAVCVSDPNENDEMKKLWAFVSMKNAVLATETNGSPKKKTLYPTYHITFFKRDAAKPSEICYIAEIYTELILNVQQFSGNIPELDNAQLTQYFDRLTVFDTAQNTANLWNNHIPAIIHTLLENNLSNLGLESLAHKLNNYQVHLEDYWQVYDEIEKTRPEALEAVCNRNLNLLLNKTLKKLEQTKQNIPMFQAALPYTPGGITPSLEQMKAITTTEPCTIIQSGAGSGKSFVIQNRLHYMKQCGVDLHNTLVLSFTNAAANHIKDIAPEVNSKTIASMICDIYDNNYKHEISTIDTMLNTIHTKHHLDDNPVAQDLVSGLRTLKKDINGGLVSLAETIRNNFNEVITILDDLKQTLFEIQSLICYYAGDTLQEPVSTCEHIIMDEVQDNSIFEFIFIIQYIIRHNASLYLVGDCSQTLYEFRASNPKAMNCLEMSGVFYCTKLQTNYRSNQNILDLANLTLKNIEANQFAKVQLYANEFGTRPFTEDVHVDYEQLPNRSGALKDAMPMLLNRAKDWIKDKLDAGEQICFLAYKRKSLEPFEQFVANTFPDKTLQNIVPAKNFAQSFFTRFISSMGEEFYHRPSADVTVEIQRAIIDNLFRICRDDQADIVRKHIAEWITKYRDRLVLRDTLVQTGALSPEAYKQEVFETMIEFEIAKNGMRQRMTTMMNNKLKEEDVSSYNFIVSTIHSAKGLEFDNVILLYDEHAAKNEEDKRMYYVGLTRAKKHEWVISYDTTRSSSLLTQFETLRDEKKKAAKQAAIQIVQSINPETQMTFHLPRVNTVTILHNRNAMLFGRVKPAVITEKITAECRRPQCTVISVKT